MLSYVNPSQQENATLKSVASWIFTSVGNPHPGQFAALNKEEVGTRLGPIGLELWDRAKERPRVS